MTNEFTRLINQINQGDRQAAGELLPIVYEELRKLAAVRLNNERSDHTLNATALVHEAYLRLAGDSNRQQWDGRAHFFAAAAEAIRRILIDYARQKRRAKRGGGAHRIELDDALLITDDRIDEALGIDEALNELERHDPQAAALVKLRFFAGFEHQEAAESLGLSRGAADRLWLLARTWLYKNLQTEKK